MISFVLWSTFLTTSGAVLLSLVHALIFIIMISHCMFTVYHYFFCLCHSSSCVYHFSSCVYHFSSCVYYSSSCVYDTCLAAPGYLLTAIAPAMPHPLQYPKWLRKWLTGSGKRSDPGFLSALINFLVEHSFYENFKIQNGRMGPKMTDYVFYEKSRRWREKGAKMGGGGGERK